VTELLEQSDLVKGHRAVLHTDLADVLSDQGKFAEAPEEYEEGLNGAKELHDLRSQGAILARLGSLAIVEGNLDEALERYRDVLALFQRLREPAAEAAAWQQIGKVFAEAQQWDEAERHLRESARLSQEGGDLAGAAGTWNNLATAAKMAGRPDAAETWYRKAIEAGRVAGDFLGLSKRLNNLGDLLRSQPGRLAEARQLAEEALAMEKGLDPGAAEIWKTCNILAKMADQEAAAAEDHRKAELQQQAAQYRRAAREAKRHFAGTRHELKRHLRLIVATLAACQGDQQARQVVVQIQAAMRKAGREWAKTADTLDRILSGERDVEALCEGLGPDSSMLIETILEALADPSALADLLPPDFDAGQEG
jgi:tetratricopeptide (TPR) repeat protein